MGFRFSKQGLEVPHNVGVHHFQRHVINYLTTKLFIRNLVSKKRRRMLVGGYDLDMSYITDRVLAMSFPAERMRAMYRNPMWQVKNVLEMRHQGHYKVFNLCIEEDYDPSHFHGRVERFPFDDNHVPPLSMIKDFCESVHSWLSSNPKNIAVVHCMAGKGRTGLMVSAYLVYTGMLAEDALHMYAHKRTTNNEGVSIPSQRRYVGYWEKILSFPRGVNCGLPAVEMPKACSRELRRIRIYDAVNIESVFFVVSQLEEVPAQKYQTPAEVSRNSCRRIKKGWHTIDCDRYYYPITASDEVGKEPDSEEHHLIMQLDTESPVIYQKTCLDYNYKQPVQQVTGDVRVAFYEKMIGGRLFYACFNTSFIRNNLLQLSMKDLDKIGKKGRSICGSAFFVELLFGPPNAIGVVSTSSDDGELSHGSNPLV